jgi:cytochrome c5
MPQFFVSDVSIAPTNQPVHLIWEFVMTRILLGVFLAVGLAGAAVASDVEDRYKRTCAVCHAAGAAGAPKTGVPADWEARMAKGMDVMVESVDKGMNAMPPKGMCFDCSADDFKALIEYMAAAK